MVDINIKEWSINKKCILQEIKFQLKKGEIIGLVGENGAGKSSIMKVITGLIVCYKGEVKYQDKNANGKKIFATFIEEPKLQLSLTGNNNLKYFGRLAGRGWEKRVEELILAWGMEPHLNKKVKDYSLGMKQKMGLLIMFMFDRPFYIIDEPTNGLDDISRKILFRHIQQLREQGKGILISSHNLNEINEVCDRIVKVHKGQIENGDYKFKKIVTIKFNQNIEKEFIEKRFEVFSWQEKSVKVVYGENFIEKLVELKKNYSDIELDAINNYYDDKR